MRIAVASEQNKIANHFSSAEGFRIYEFEGQIIHVCDYIENEASIQNNLAKQLADLEVVKMIAGGIGFTEIEKLNCFGIEVIDGIEGDVADAVIKLLNGELHSYDGKDLTGGCGC